LFISLIRPPDIVVGGIPYYYKSEAPKPPFFDDFRTWRKL